MGKKGSIDLTMREILILVLVVIILAVVLFIGISKLGLISKVLELLSNQGNIVGSAA